MRPGRRAFQEQAHAGMGSGDAAGGAGDGAAAGGDANDVVVKLVMIRCGRGGGDVDGDGDDVCGSYRSHCSSDGDSVVMDGDDGGKR